MASGGDRAQNNQQVPADEDDFDFGGFEAADPEPAGEGMQAEAQASLWAAIALGGAQERPDLLCAQNRFPPYLDPSDISGASADSRSMAIGGNVDVADVAPLPSVAADLLGDAQFVDIRQRPAGPEQGENRLNGRLPDLGLGINDNPLFSQPLMNGPAANHQAPVAAVIPNQAPQQQQLLLPQQVQQQQMLQQQMRIDDVSAANGGALPPQPPLQPLQNVNAAVEPNVDNAAAAVAAVVPQNNEMPRIEDQEASRNLQQQQQQAVQEALEQAGNDVAAGVEERRELTQRLESLMERNQVLEEELERSRGELATQGTRLHEIEARHSETLQEVRRASQDALSVVVEEYKEQLKAMVLQQKETSQQHMVETLREQTAAFRELFDLQRQKHEEERAKDKDELKRHVEKALEDSRVESNEKFQTFLQEEQEKLKRDFEKAVQEERAASRAEMEKAVKEEQATAKDRLDEARAEYSAKLEEERKRQEAALATVRKEEAERAKEHMASLVSEERERGRESVREALEGAHADTRSYISEQRRRDSNVRQRHFSSLDLFLESCRQQISFLMNHETGDEGAALQLPQAVGRGNHQDQHNNKHSESEDGSKESGDS